MATSQGRNQLSFSGGKNDCNLLYLTTKHVFEIARLTPWLPAFNCTDDPGLVQGPFCSALSAAKWAKGSTSLIGWDAASSWSDCRTRTSTRWSWERRWRTWPKTWWLPVFRLNVFLSAVTADVVRFKLRMTLIWLRCPASNKSVKFLYHLVGVDVFWVTETKFDRKALLRTGGVLITSKS